MLSIISNLALKIIPSQYLWIAKIIGVLALVLGLIFSGYKLAVWHYSPLLEKAEYQLQVCSDNYSTLKDLSEKQNKAILELNAAKEIKAKQVQQAQENAKKLSQINNKQAQDILRLQLGNQDACEAASNLVDEELAKERK